MRKLGPIFWILSLAFILRVTGLGFGLPYPTHQDEPIVVNHALAYASGDWNPHFFKIPPLTSYLLFAVYGIFYGILHFFLGWNVERFAGLFFADPSAFYVLARLVFGAILGTCSVAVLYRLAEKALSPRAALVSALFFAVSFLHVRDSHYVYADIPMILAMLLVFCALLEDRALKAGFWLGVAVAFKYIAAPLSVCIFWAFRRDPKKWFLAAVMSVATYALFNPYSFLDWSFFCKEIQAQAGAESASGLSHHLLYSLFGGQGTPMVLLGLAGLFLFFKNKAEFRFLALFPLLWYAVIAVFSQNYERYALPMAPFLCLFAAYGVEQAAKKMHEKQAAVLIFICLVIPLAKSVYLDWLATRPDTRRAAEVWMSENLPEGSVVAVNQPFFSPRLSQADAQWREKEARISIFDPQYALKKKKLALMQAAAKNHKRFNVFYLRNQKDAEPSFSTWSPWMEIGEESFRKAGVGYVVRYRFEEEDGVLEDILRRRGQLFKVFSPYFSSEKKETADHFSQVGLPFLSRELFSRKAPGPYLELYKISSA